MCMILTVTDNYLLNRSCHISIQHLLCAQKASNCDISSNLNIFKLSQNHSKLQF